MLPPVKIPMQLRSFTSHLLVPNFNTNIGTMDFSLAPPILLNMCPSRVDQLITITAKFIRH